MREKRNGAQREGKKEGRGARGKSRYGEKERGAKAKKGREAEKKKRKQDESEKQQKEGSRRKRERGEGADNVPENAPTFPELMESKEWKGITDEVVKEFNEFIGEESMKVGSNVQSAIRPDVVVTKRGLLDNPKIITNKKEIRNMRRSKSLFER